MIKDPLRPQPVSTALTDGVRVTVVSRYVAEQSEPSQKRFVFSYTITISNESKAPLQLKTRYWIITHSDGRTEEVRGPGVVGKQPLIKPGDQFRYSSGAVLQTQRGTMRGSYQMARDDGSLFDVEIGAFALQLPITLN